MYFLIYISGFLTVWIIDKIHSDHHSWEVVVSRFSISMFSWLSLILYLVSIVGLEVMNFLAKQIKSKTDKQPPSWL